MSDMLRKIMGNVTLQHGVRYLAPSGRECMLCPTSSGNVQAEKALLLYSSPDDRSAPKSTDDGFTLSRFNWYLLRAVG
jgi:hypothetical protein